MSKPFDNGFICDICGFHLDMWQYGDLVEVNGDVIDVCCGCLEDGLMERGA
jgi:hypothetical protein